MLAGSYSALAQNNPNEEQGLKPYDSFHGGDLDSVSLTTGGLALHIPLASFPQRGNLDLGFMVRFSSKQWYMHTHCTNNPSGGQTCTRDWAPMGNTGVQVVSSVDWWMQGTHAADGTGFDWTRGVTSPDGNTHQFGGDDGGETLGPTYPLRSLDATGLLQPDAQTLILPNGTRYSYPNFSDSTITGPPPSVAKQGVQASTITDANGNQISIGSAGWTDTLNRLIPGQSPGSGLPVQPGVPTSDLSKCPTGTSSALIWNVPGVAAVNSGVRTFYFCYSLVTLSTNFQVSGIAEYGPTSQPVLTAVVLPDLTQWTFSYNNYGDVTQLGFPTGGSITYAYGTGPLSGSAGTPTSRWVTSRTVDATDGTGGHLWQYQYAPQFNGLLYIGNISTVISPDGNDTVHTITVLPIAGTFSPYDTQVQYYQGHASGGTLLKTVSTQYAGIFSPYGTSITGAVNVVPTQVTTTLAGGQTSRVVNTYDSTNSVTQQYSTGTATIPVVFGSVLQHDEYDFSNTLVRSTVNHYLWQDNATYTANNFISLVVSSTLKDGAGCEVAKTSQGYDEAYNGISLQPSFVSTQFVAAPAPVRGNHTSSSKFLVSACAEQSSITSHTIPYDTGLPYQSFDPLNHFTQYTYSPTFAGAYLTQTNLPDTQMPDTGAPVVHHIISGDYDSNTGLLTTFTDENGQPYTYTYDIMLRLTQGHHPDGGITKFLYPDPNTVERQRLITGTTYDDFKVKFDGLGRPYQTQQLTPDCTSYIKVDTTYDSVGRAKTVSNPYCLTSEPTYGITTSAYDALSRTTQTTKQDNSFTTVKYEDTPADPSSTPLVCTTATDESGKKRQACSDAFGRLVKVVEPNPGATATNGTGWVTISGTEQTATSQPATSGQATITISGTEQFVQQCVLNHCTTTYDNGTVTITVSGFSSKTVTYGGVDTPATIAWKLSCAFHNDTTSAADAACPASAGSSTQVVLTARATGTASNYAFTTASATTDQTGNFGTASFTAAPASGAFSNGQNASTTSDSGSITITINGTPYSTSFGAGDTSTTIASRLATAISAGPYASATPSGGTVNLTSKTSGTAGDFSLSAAYTWNSAQFTNPSFTTSTSGSALSGAKDASALNNNPFVTTYQYNTRGDLLCVHQKATDTSADVPCTGASAPSVPATWRQRFFTYDSFSRLLTASNPEISSQSGPVAITYQYDNDGNVSSKTGPAPNQSFTASPVQMLTITYAYDALNRLTDTTYSDGTTPKVSHRYDYASFLGQTFAYPIGREVAATTANNTIESFTSYDRMGRVASTTQCNPGVSGCKTFSVGNGSTLQGYDKLGNVLNLIYPGNGFTLTYGYDSAARLTSATDSNGVIYAQTPTYLAMGAIQEFTSPNFNGNKYHVDYNSRLQPTEIWAGTSAGAGALFDKQYSYGATGSNNGNIYTITNVKDTTRTQSFSYDALNRLITAGDQTHWSNSYVYDAWGNLYQKNPGVLPGEGLSAVPDTNNHLSGLTYDAAGNVTNDGLGGVFFFDAENRIKTAGSVTYFYDAYGRRIQKSTGINYWYGPGGQAFAETDSAGNWTNYIFFGGRRLARNVNGDIKYYITDHLHSTALFVDKAGTSAAILDDNDYYPWGSAIPGVGKNTSNNTVKFTGHYRDGESNLDYFGARYYSSVTGRFMSVDPIMLTWARLFDPQAINLYSYALNNPITNFDPDGAEVVQVAYFTLTEYTQVGPEIGPLDGFWAMAGVAAAGGPGAREYRNSTGIGQFQFHSESDLNNDQGVISEMSPFSQMATFRVTDTQYAIDVDFREDPGAGEVATIRIDQTGPGMIYSHSSRVVQRPMNWATSSISGCGKGTFICTAPYLRNLSDSRLTALLTAIYKEMVQHPFNLILEELLHDVQVEQLRRDEEKKREKEKRKRKGLVHNAPSGLDLAKDDSGFGVGPR
jgi:RHS repeat-associated protein